MRGCFSIVFKAFDRLNSRFVALKFYDRSPSSSLNIYRQDCFRREHTILEALQNAYRRLQLRSSLNTYNLVVPTVGGIDATIPCSYFAIDWIDEEIDQYFLDPLMYSAIDKLQVFREIVLATQALHQRSIFHRDLKADNLRRDSTQVEPIVVAIDLGTAAKLDSIAVASGIYGQPAGASAYAAIEALVGLAGNRRLAQYTDIYALGCLLFELFNPDWFIRALFDRNPNYDALIMAVSSMFTSSHIEAEQVMILHRALTQYAGGVTPVLADGVGSCLPPGLAQMINSLLVGMTSADYRSRPSFETIRGRIASAMSVLRHEEAYQKKLSNAREARRLKLERISIREARNLARQNGTIS